LRWSFFAIGGYFLLARRGLGGGRGLAYGGRRPKAGVAPFKFSAYKRAFTSEAALVPSTTVMVETDYVISTLGKFTRSLGIVETILEDAQPYHLTLFDLVVNPPVRWGDQLINIFMQINH